MSINRIWIYNLFLLFSPFTIFQSLDQPYISYPIVVNAFEYMIDWKLCG